VQSDEGNTQRKGTEFTEEDTDTLAVDNQNEYKLSIFTKKKRPLVKDKYDTEGQTTIHEDVYKEYENFE
jgi:hypothetical protein